MDLLHRDDKLVISLDGKIDYKFASNFQNIVNQSKSLSFSLLEVDFRNATVITLPGAMYLIFTVKYIVDIKRDYFETLISGYSELQLNLLCNYGFFNIMSIYGNVRLSPDISQFSTSRPNYWKNILKKPPIKLSRIHWPIAIIPRKLGIHFNTEVIKFHNDFINFFQGMIHAGLISNFTQSEQTFVEKSFLKSINEAIKNVWDHSESWGIASVESSKYNKTTLCLFDFGIGFLKSYSQRMGNYERTFTRDREVLIWLFKEGNTSQSGINHGHGLPIIQKFVDITQGKLLIKTDNYLIKYDKKNGLDVAENSYYPGTQIMINF